MCCLWTCVSSLTDCAASGLVCSTTACAASGRVSLLWRPVLLLNVSLLCAFPGHVRVSVLQQSVMSSEVSGLQLHACASNARICSMLCQEVHGLQQLVLHLYCLSARACAAPGRVCLHGLLCYTCVSVYKSFVLHTDVSGYKSFVLHLDVSAYKSFVLHAPVHVCLQELYAACTCACLSTRALCCMHLCMSVYKSFVLHAPVHVCLQELCDAPGRVCQQECSPGCNCRCAVENLFGLFRFVSKQFCLFWLFRYRFETPKKPKYFVFGFTKQT
jgi:hypothetical protein